MHEIVEENHQRAQFVYNCLDWAILYISLYCSNSDSTND